jgi:hypothetical protein
MIKPKVVWRVKPAASGKRLIWRCEVVVPNLVPLRACLLWHHTDVEAMACLQTSWPYLMTTAGGDYARS